MTSNTTHTRIRAALIRALDHIELHLDSPPSLAQLSDISGLSMWHFQRVFAHNMGISASRYSKLTRLQRAGYQVAFRPEQSITDIGLTAGYDSPEAFSRAFQRAFGQAPRAFRSAPDWALLSTFSNTLWHREQHMKSTREAQYQVDIVEFEPVSTALMVHQGPPHLLGRSLQQFIQWRRDNRLPPTRSRTFNVLYDDPAITAADEYRFGLAAEVPTHWQQDGQLTSLCIPAGHCARVRHRGSDAGLEQVVTYLYQQWLPQSGHEPGEFPLFFERLNLFPDVSPAEANTDVYLPLR